MPSRRNANLEDIRGRDPKLFEVLRDLFSQQQNLAQQVNGNPTGQPLPPPAIDGLTVSGQNGHFDIQVSHNAEIFRGIRYYAEYADNPSFSNPRVVPMGDSRNHSLFLGNGTYYFRAYAAYPTSAPSDPAYHGGRSNPAPVAGGGGVGGPALLESQGSGTGAPGEGISGPGRTPFRSSTGAPPVRGVVASGAGGGSVGGSLPPAGPATGLPDGGLVGVATPEGGGSGMNLLNIQRVPISVASHTVSPPGGGLLWIVFLLQDAATPTDTVTWGAGTSAVSSNVDATASTLSPFIFAWDASVSLWVMAVQGGTGMAA